MSVRPTLSASYEALFHESGSGACSLHLRHPSHEAVRRELMPARLERAFGVIYRPETELQSHYFEAVLPRQFDEYVCSIAPTPYLLWAPRYPPASQIPISSAFSVRPFGLTSRRFSPVVRRCSS